MMCIYNIFNRKYQKKLNDSLTVLIHDNNIDFKFNTDFSSDQTIQSWRIVELKQQMRVTSHHLILSKCRAVKTVIKKVKNILTAVISDSPKDLYHSKG